MAVSGDKKITELPQAVDLNLDDLLAVVHEGVTSKVSLRELVSELNIEIPQPRIRIRRDVDGFNFGHDEAYAYWEGSDSKFLKHNPQFWLYRYKKAQLRTYIDRKTKLQVKEWVKKRFVHPANKNGAGKTHDSLPGRGPRFFGGFPVQNPNLQLYANRNTEWDVAADPLDETRLNLEAWKWYRLPGLPDNQVMSPQVFPVTGQPTPRGTGSSKSRMIVFKVRIAIDNPNPESGHPKLFGPFSETFVLYPHKSGGLYTGFKYFLGSEAAPQLRSKP